MNPSGVVRQPGKNGPRSPRQSSTTARPRCSARHDHQPADRGLGGRAAAEELDPALVQQGLHGRGGGRSKDLEGFLLRGYERELVLAQAPLDGVSPVIRASS